MSFVKFPHTPHLAWLGAETPRHDKVLSDDERDAFLAGELVVEEKVDGANVGLSVGPDGRIRAQNRGAYLGRGAHPQFEPLWPWIAEREPLLVDALGERLMLFGEWCFAVHSVRYDELPDWFLAFDVYDREEGRFWSTRRRNELLTTLGVRAVPEVTRGRFTLEALMERLGDESSRVGRGSAEGFYLRREDDAWLLARAKLVRAEFVQAIEEHWSKRALEKNRLATSGR